MWPTALTPSAVLVPQARQGSLESTSPHGWQDLFTGSLGARACHGYPCLVFRPHTGTSWAGFLSIQQVALPSSQRKQPAGALCNPFAWLGPELLGSLNRLLPAPLPLRHCALGSSMPVVGGGATLLPVLASPAPWGCLR